MRTPTNLSAYVLKNCIELQWDAPVNAGHKYEIIRYRDSTEASTETLSSILAIPRVDNNRISYIDDRHLKRGSFYYYAIDYLDGSNFVAQNRAIRVQFQSTAPMPVSSIRLIVLSKKLIAISWEDYAGDISSDVEKYEIYIEPISFFSINGLYPKATSTSKSSIYKYDRQEELLYVAVVPVGIGGKKVLGVTPSVIQNAWKNPLSRSLEIHFSIVPLVQNKNKEIVIDVIDGEPNSIYHILIGDHILDARLSTNIYGIGRVYARIPESIISGRHSITVDNGEGSSASIQNALLIPVRLSPMSNDVIQSAYNVDITTGFDTSIIDRVRFYPEKASLRFKHGSSPSDFRLNLPELFVMLETGAAIYSTGQRSVNKINIPARTLPSFTYPPFLYNRQTGSLNFIGLVQRTNFSMVMDWADHINELHLYGGGTARVVRSIIEFNSDTQAFGKAMIDTGEIYQEDYAIELGKSYWIEVKEPVLMYAISGDGFVSLEYKPILATNNGSMNCLVLVADGQFPDASSWAMEINTQYNTQANFERVVRSITEWNPNEQEYGSSMVDTGDSYQGNFNLIPGAGYIIEVKQTVPGFVITGDTLTSPHH